MPTDASALIHVKVSPSDEIERLVEIADQGCIMVNTLRGKLELSVRTHAAVSMRCEPTTALGSPSYTPAS